jgi:hypothetical protein
MHPVHRTCSHAALTFIVLAIGTETISKSHISAGVRSLAQSAERLNRAKAYVDLEMDEWAIEALDQKVMLEQRAHLKFDRASYWAIGGLVLFILALGFFGSARGLGEQSSAVPFVCLAIGYLLWLMCLV